MRVRHLVELDGFSTVNAGATPLKPEACVHHLVQLHVLALMPALPQELLHQGDHLQHLRGEAAPSKPDPASTRSHSASPCQVYRYETEF